MRKQTKLVAVLSAAALLAIGASMTSFAATGWAEENGTWVYYDKDGNAVTDTWKKSGNNWFYLNEDGQMATSSLVEDESYTYYVDDSGVMVTNKWVQLENENYYDASDDDEEPENVWYYFQSTGKAYKSDDTKTSFKTISGKQYAFDADGKMLFGWVDDNAQRVTGDDAFTSGVYYCGDSDDGARVSNKWANLYISDNGPGDELEDQEYVWFWFQNNGKKFYATAEKDTDNDGIVNKKVNGKNYAFDESGIMRSEWQASTQNTASKMIGYYSDIEDGARQKGWFKAVPSVEVNEDDYNDDAAHWYYGNNDGKLVESQIKTINSKKYAFNEKGEMLSGLFALELKDSKILKYEKIGDEAEVNADNFYTVASTVKNKATGQGTVGVYYFSASDDDGSLKTGNQNVTVDGDVYQFSFKKDGANKGEGITSKDKDKVLYVMGKKIKADSDCKYQVADRVTGEIQDVSVDATSFDKADYAIINTSGSIMTGTSYYKDGDGYYYHISGDNITYTSSNKASAN